MERFDESVKLLGTVDFKTIFTESELCEKLGVTKSTLSKWRSQGKAPPSSKKGRVRFYWDIEQWIRNSAEITKPVKANFPLSTAVENGLAQTRAVDKPVEEHRIFGSTGTSTRNTHFHVHRSRPRSNAGAPATSCPKCLSSGKAFRSRFVIWDLPLLCFGIVGLRCGQCMHRFYGSAKQVPIPTKTKIQEPEFSQPELAPQPKGFRLIRGYRIGWRNSELDRMKTAA